MGHLGDALGFYSSVRVMVKKAEKTIEALSSIMKFADSSPEVQVGLFEDGRAGKKHPDANMTILELGRLHEHGFQNGSKFVPPRPFVKSVKQNKKFMRNALSALRRAINKAGFGREVLDGAMKGIARRSAAALRKQLRSGTVEPALHPITNTTVRGKGSRIPLVDQGTLAAAVEGRLKGAKK